MKNRTVTIEVTQTLGPFPETFVAERGGREVLENIRQGVPVEIRVDPDDEIANRWINPAWIIQVMELKDEEDYA